MLSDQSFLILVAGPYRSGPSRHSHLIQDNGAILMEAALQLYQMGHLPILSEWVALLILKAAGSREVGDTLFNALFHPITVQLIDHCNAVLHLGGTSAGADVLVNIARLKGKIIFHHLSEIQIVNPANQSRVLL